VRRGRRKSAAGLKAYAFFEEDTKLPPFLLSTYSLLQNILPLYENASKYT
jgi:hypothetical protein